MQTATASRSPERLPSADLLFFLSEPEQKASADFLNQAKEISFPRNYGGLPINSSNLSRSTSWQKIRNVSLVNRLLWDF
jgi:hypothetical protein